MSKEIMNAEQLSRTLKRMTHEIIEHNQDLNHLIFVGILNKGLPVAQALANNFKRFTDIDIPCFGLDITAYRDDDKELKKPVPQNIDVTHKRVILVDDVLYTGRSVRAGMDALVKYGRPEQIQLAILIDRGHRELPIRADYIGKNVPTSLLESILVDIENQSVKLITKSE
ncbi:MAG: bifunctional pyr operon transcriptional regulator/uracil phosphoribosyltransferase PyrR [Acholeplasmataceae bacterium]